MIRGFVLLSGLIVAVAGIVLLLWLLWILWKFKTVEPEPPAIETGTSETESEIEPTERVEAEISSAAEEGNQALQDTIEAEREEE